MTLWALLHQIPYGPNGLTSCIRSGCGYFKLNLSVSWLWFTLLHLITRRKRFLLRQNQFPWHLNFCLPLSQCHEKVNEKAFFVAHIPENKTFFVIFYCWALNAVKLWLNPICESGNNQEVNMNRSIQIT